MTPHRIYNEQRFARIIAYLHENYAEKLDLNRIAEEACLSPYHWHRIYRGVLGETIHATLKRIRLQQAAWLLANSDKSVTAIAREVGYGGNPQSFTRIFRESHGASPEDYRAHSRLPYRERQAEKLAAYPVAIRTIAPLAIISLDHHGDYMQIGDTFHRLYSLLQLRGISCAARSFGIYHHCPHATPADELFAQAAIAASDAVEPPLQNATIRGGRYAVMRHQGSYAELDRAYDWFYRDWLLQSPYEIADAPPIEEYLNDVQTTAPQDLLTDIYIPLVEGDQP